MVAYEAHIEQTELGGFKIINNSKNSNGDDNKYDHVSRNWKLLKCNLSVNVKTNSINLVNECLDDLQV